MTIDVSATPRRAMSRMRRLKIFESAMGVCVLCKLKICGGFWTVEHIVPLGLGGADSDENTGPAHEACRRIKDREDVPRIAKAKRIKIKHIHGYESRNPMPGGRRSKWKKKMDGSVVLR